MNYNCFFDYLYSNVLALISKGDSKIEITKEVSRQIFCDLLPHDLRNTLTMFRKINEIFVGCENSGYCYKILHYHYC